MSDLEDEIEIPGDWRWRTLGDVCDDPQYGWTTSAAEKGSVRLLRTSDITSGDVNWDEVPFCEEDPDNVDKYRLEKGDIVISRAGSVGFSYLVTNPKDAVFASYLIRFRPQIDPNYVSYFLQSPMYWRSISEKKAGIAVQNVNATKLKQVAIPVPPTDQQRRIVSRIEELFSNVDAGVESLQTAKRQLERYRLSVLKAAVEGRLTGEWRRTHKPEPADRLLDQILEERREQWEADYRMRRYEVKGKTPPSGWRERYSPPEPPEERQPRTLPDGWQWVTVDQLSPNIHYGYTESATDEPVGPRFLRITDIQEGRVNWDDVPHCEIGEKEREKYLLNPGDIVFARTGGTVGKSYLVKDDVPEAVFASYLIRVITAQSFEEEFLYLFFQTLDYWRQISESKTGIGQPNVNATKLSKIVLPLPPLAEQRKIVDEVERLLSVAEDGLRSVTRETERASRLRQSILKRAFSGGLR